MFWETFYDLEPSELKVLCSELESARDKVLDPKSYAKGARPSKTS